MLILDTLVLKKLTNDYMAKNYSWLILLLSLTSFINLYSQKTFIKTVCSNSDDSFVKGPTNKFRQLFKNYPANINYIEVLYPDNQTKNRVVVDFSYYFNTTLGDVMYIYDGPNTTFEKIGELSGPIYSYIGIQTKFKSSHESGALTVQFISGNNNSNDYWKGNISCEKKPDCPRPRNIVISEITGTSAQVDWDLEENDTIWYANYGVNEIKLNTNSLFLDKLTPNTTYELKINKACSNSNTGGTSTIKFTTVDDYCGGAHFYDKNGSEDPLYSGGQYSIQTIYPDYSNDRVRVIFDYISGFGSYDLQIFDGPNSSFGSKKLDWKNGEREFVSNHKTGSLTFVASVGISSSLNWDAHVICEPSPECYIPQNFKSSTQKDNNNIILTWDSNSIEDNTWIVEYGKNGFKIGDGTQIITNETSVTLENLNLGTEYTAYVKTVCKYGSYSDSANLNFDSPPDYCGNDHFYTKGNIDSSTYNRYDNYTKTIFPGSESELVTADFIKFHTDTGGYLRIYNGPGTSSELIGTYSSLNSPGKVVSSHESGALTFVFDSTLNGVTSDWDAQIKCVPNKIETISSKTIYNNYLNKNISLFPNPNNGTFSINNSSNSDILEIAVHNVNGNPIQTTNVEYNLDENYTIENVTSGVYFIQITTNNGVIIKRIIVQ